MKVVQTTTKYRAHPKENLIPAASEERKNQRRSEAHFRSNPENRLTMRCPSRHQEHTQSTRHRCRSLRVRMTALFQVAANQYARRTSPKRILDENRIGSMSKHREEKITLRCPPRTGVPQRDRPSAGRSRRENVPIVGRMCKPLDEPLHLFQLAVDRSIFQKADEPPLSHSKHHGVQNREPLSSKVFKKNKLVVNHQ